MYKENDLKKFLELGYCAYMVGKGDSYSFFSRDLSFLNPVKGHSE